MLKKTSLFQRIALVSFGLFLAVMILEIGLRIGGLAILSMQEYRNLQSIKQKGEFRIMCLGESTTQNQYPLYLEEILNQSNLGVKFSVIDKGIGSINTMVILGQLESNLDKYQPDMVVTMMGVNDGGGHIPYEAASASKIILTLRSFKTYKLARLLWLHMTTKFKEVSKKQNSVQQEQSSEKAPEFNPKNDFVYAELGWIYRGQGKFIESEQTFKKALELNPGNDLAYAGLGKLYSDQVKFSESEQMLKKALELNSNNDTAYTDLGWLYRNQKKIAEAEQLFKKALELNPSDGSAQIGLGGLYRDQGKFTEAEQLFKKAIEFDPDTDFLYGSLATIYSEIGNDELSKMYAEKTNGLRNKYYNSVTVDNYRALKQILDKRKIRLICVQYPMRDTEPLKKIFKEETENSIVFVDNEKIFKDAVRKGSYKKYFVDMFGGDFGHCTDEGNRLLAGNIADSILKEIFNK